MLQNPRIYKRFTGLLAPASRSYSSLNVSMTHLDTAQCNDPRGNILEKLKTALGITIVPVWFRSTSSS